MSAADPSSSATHLQWGAEALWTQLQPLLPGLSVEVVARSASTSSELLDRARMAPPSRPSRFGELGEPCGRIGRRQADTQPCLLVAEQQLAGRGRLGRSWRSAAGASLTFSLALPLAPPGWAGLSVAVGAALAEALQPQPAAGEPRLAVKWPNDLWLLDAASPERGALPGRKLGGVLVETLAAGQQRLVVVGVGLNVLPLPAAMTADLVHGAACLQEIDAAVTAPAALARIALPLLVALRQFEREGYAGFAARFAARDMLRDCAITTSHPQVPSGIARGTDESSGALRVEAPDGSRHLLVSGEVSVRLGQTAAGVAPSAAPSPQR